MATYDPSLAVSGPRPAELPTRTGVFFYPLIFFRKAHQPTVLPGLQVCPVFHPYLIRGHQRKVIFTLHSPPENVKKYFSPYPWACYSLYNVYTVNMFTVFTVYTHAFSSHSVPPPASFFPVSSTAGLRDRGRESPSGIAFKVGVSIAGSLRDERPAWIPPESTTGLNMASLARQTRLSSSLNNRFLLFLIPPTSLEQTSDIKLRVRG